MARTKQYNDGLSAQQRYYQKNKAIIKEKDREREKTRQRQPRDRSERKQIKYPKPKNSFCGIDGEAFRENGNSYYALISASGCTPLVVPDLEDATKPLRCLTTIEILNWLFGYQFKGKTIVGYGFNYDFENWLVDLHEVQYRALFAGLEVIYMGYTLKYVPSKILRISKESEKGKIIRTVYNCIGFWQSSFVKALQSMGLGDRVSPEILEGKASRAEFSRVDLAKVLEYNRQECEALADMMGDLFARCREAFKLADLGFAPSASCSYGPGAFAKRFLAKSCDFGERHPALTWNSDDLKRFENLTVSGQHISGDWNTFEDTSLGEVYSPYVRAFPFAASYTGGRIELAGIGYFDKLYHYDIRSAYPAAMARLPDWSNDDADFIYDDKILLYNAVSRRFIGQYLVSWDYRKKTLENFYPFAFRTNNGGVYYPAKGRAWIMSPELFAVLDTWGSGYLYIEAAMVIKRTSGLGDGVTAFCPDTRSSRRITDLYNQRQHLKNENNGAELPLKLTLNSAYGQCMQQVGVNGDLDKIRQNKHLFRDVVSSWITSWTRAMIWRAIAFNTDSIVAIQTDGLLSRVPLSIETGEGLGCWDADVYTDVTTLQPGIYRYTDAKGKTDIKRRGLPSTFDFDSGYASLFSTEEYKCCYETFVNSRMAYSRPLSLEGKRLQWAKMEKVFKADVSSKRGGKNSDNAKLSKKSPRIFFPPRENTAPNLTSIPYKLDFAPPEFDIMELENLALMGENRDEEFNYNGSKE